jgi:hypothetical protein
MARSFRRLRAIKWSPALLWGYIAGEDIQAAEVEPVHLDRGYVENTFGSGAIGTLRQLVRLWVQDGNLFGESTDDF